MKTFSLPETEGVSMFLSVSHEEVNRLKLGVFRKVIHFQLIKNMQISTVNKAKKNLFSKWQQLIGKAI